MIQLTKYHESVFTIPAVVDFINYQHHAVIDVIQTKDELFKVGDEISYNGIDMEVYKQLKKYPIQTEEKITNRKDFLKVRYFCNKINKQPNHGEQKTLRADRA